MDQQTKQTRFINKCVTKYGSLYDYSKVHYINAHTAVTIICSEHGPFNQRPNDHLTGYGCPKCGSIKRKNTTLERYGVEHAQQSTAIRAKSKNTMLERYGVEHATQSDELLNIRNNNNISKYGVPHPSQTQSIKEKIKHTNRLKYGVDYTMQHTQTKAKAIDTTLKRYGVAYALQHSMFMNKFVSTMMTRYGSGHPMQVAHIIKQRANTILMRYGTIHPSQQHMRDILPLLNDYNWLYDQYIVKQKTAQKIAQDLNICDSTVTSYLKQHEIDIRYSVGFSYKCVDWLTSIMDNNNVHIQHALNGGEYVIPNTRYKVDGFCKDTNTVYEFHGTIYHGDPNVFRDDERCHPWSMKTAKELYDATISREQEIRSLGYNLVTTWEREWDAINTR